MQIEKNPNIIPRQYSSIDDFLTKCPDISTTYIAREVLPKNSEEQSIVDVVNEHISNLEKGESEQIYGE